MSSGEEDVARMLLGKQERQKDNKECNGARNGISNKLIYAKKGGIEGETYETRERD